MKMEIVSDRKKKHQKVFPLKNRQAACPPECFVCGNQAQTSQQKRYPLSTATSVKGTPIRRKSLVLTS